MVNIEMIDEVLIEFLHMEMVDTLSTPVNNNEHTVTKLENVGYRTGFKLIERVTKDSKRFKDDLDILKYICKDFWAFIFLKQVDNLKTDHQGTYVLTDKQFRFLTHISNTKQYIDIMPKYLAFTCGLLRGALANLGIQSIVSADVSAPPSCEFNVKIQQNKDY